MNAPPATDFKFSLAGTMSLGPFRFSEVTAEFVGVPRGVRDEDSVLFARESAMLWITGVVAIGHGKFAAKYPTQFAIRAISDMEAQEKGSEFSIEGFNADFNGYKVHLATTPAACDPL